MLVRGDTAAVRDAAAVRVPHVRPDGRRRRLRRVPAHVPLGPPGGEALGRGAVLLRLRRQVAMRAVQAGQDPKPHGDAALQLRADGAHLRAAGLVPVQHVPGHGGAERVLRGVRADVPPRARGELEGGGGVVLLRLRRQGAVRLAAGAGAAGAAHGGGRVLVRAHGQALREAGELQLPHVRAGGGEGLLRGVRAAVSPRPRDYPGQRDRRLLL
mmetsp:Transcript_9054/g.31991  ORF Transcript_9054/g.31991 Transcript_9054/m.31991 type:complete len:213 (-) Transcript_9054:161-799(-)